MAVEITEEDIKKFEDAQKLELTIKKFCVDTSIKARGESAEANVSQKKSLGTIKKAQERLISEADESSGHWITTDTGQHVFISDTLSGRGFKLKDIGGVKVEKNSSNLPKDAVAGYEPKTKTIYTTPDATPEDVDHEMAHHIASEVYADPKHIPSVEKLFDNENFASSVDKLGGFDTEYGKGNTGELWADTFSAMKNNPAEMEKLVSKNPELKKLTDIIQKDSGYSFEDFKKAKGSKSEGIFIYENDLEPGQRWITLPGGQHILVGPGAPSGLKRTPSTPKEPKTREPSKRISQKQAEKMGVELKDENDKFNAELKTKFDETTELYRGVNSTDGVRSVLEKGELSGGPGAQEYGFVSLTDRKSVV